MQEPADGGLFCLSAEVPVSACATGHIRLDA